MAQFKHVISSLRLTISLGEEEGKSVTKTVSLSNISGAATADDLSAVAAALGELLEYPVASVRKYDTELIESA